jgi:aminocarboxymuconate-semialdehyde decarboxylase
MNVIDMHSHFLPHSWPDFTKKFGASDWPWMKHLSAEKALVMKGDKEFRPVSSAVWDADIRLADMDRHGIDIQIMSATPLLFSYDRPAHQAAEIARLFNDAALEICTRGKGRLKALCQVPLQDIDMACIEVTRAMNSGHLGVQIGNHVGDIDIDNEGIVTFLHHCADIGAAVLVHPWDMMAPERTAKYMLPWLVSMPAETQLSLTALILSGAFERLPTNLKICFAHGGGGFAFLLGRIDNAWHNRDIVRRDCPKPPSSYTNRFYVDSAVFDSRALDLLVAVMGPDHVMLGSDYPYPLGELEIGKLIRNMTTLDDTIKSGLLGGNAETFFHFNLEYIEKTRNAS